MTSSLWFRRFAFAYATAFAVVYVVALARDLALFTVYPSLGVVLLGTHHARDVAGPSMGFVAPAMYWYGWMATAALAAFILSVARAMDAAVLAGVGVVSSRDRDGRLRLSHHALVSALKMGRVMTHTGEIAPSSSRSHRKRNTDDRASEQPSRLRRHFRAWRDRLERPGGGGSARLAGPMTPSSKTSWNRRPKVRLKRDRSGQRGEVT